MVPDLVPAIGYAVERNRGRARALRSVVCYAGPQAIEAH
jgi:hypothetical protein